ncbi:MAG: hypothetical protein K0S18_1093 [Anaerocolumna sp.]|jgi:hypothetical protein|nr:hypothetical protein [Anaerocolumna sp.]
MEQNHQEELKVLSRADFIKLARDNCSRNISSISSDKNIPYQNIRQSSPAKRLLIRFIFALCILLSVIVIDKIDEQFNNKASLAIEKWVSSNQSIEEAEAFFVSLFEKITEE